tara:strand:+ start:218 stop:376 length:159 start_codon:yes stop_codon:yes gene_type:complete
MDAKVRGFPLHCRMHEVLAINSSAVPDGLQSFPNQAITADVIAACYLTNQYI